MTFGDTIAALATAATPAARVIVRASGPAAAATATRLCPAHRAAAGSAALVELTFAGLTCPAWVYAFHGPRSYTGEDVVEYHLPGNPILARLLFGDLLAAGHRPAEPGEFTARGYFAGRFDLTAAEGVAATIAASNAAELAAARQLLAGEFARRLRPVVDTLADTLALIEAGIDFAGEEVTFLDAATVHERVAAADAALAALGVESAAFEPLTHVPRVVLAGRPNAGKSTLLNALAGQARAVVSPAAGTTRDALSTPVDLAHGRIDLIDVAGLDENDDHGVNAVANAVADVGHLMRQTARRTIESADRVVEVRDSADGRPPLPLSRTPDLLVWTKIDLPDSAPMPSNTADLSAVAVGAGSGTGLAAVRVALDRISFGTVAEEAVSSRLALNRRHRSLMAEAGSALARARRRPEAEFIAADLRLALNAIGTITGSATPDDVLGRVFATFCIGK